MAFIVRSSLHHLAFKFLSEETAKSSAKSFSLMFVPFYAAVVIVVVVVAAAVAASKIVA